MGDKGLVVSRGASIVLVFLLIFTCLTGAAQSNQSPGAVPVDSVAAENTREVLIDNIFITGNRKTKDKIILRELSVEIGKYYKFEGLREMLDFDRNKIYNTNLFNTVEVSILELDMEKIDIVVQVDERWYLFPIPLIDIIDRNFNDWVENHNADLSRIIYGLSLYHFNMRGMNERMTLTAQFGFSRRYEFQYDVPYIDRSQQNGLGFFVKFIEYKNLHYDNINNNRVFLESEDILKTNIFTGINYVRRNSFYARHFVDFAYSDSEVADTIFQLNPNYHTLSNKRQQYFNLKYKFSYDKRDIVAYPLNGYRLTASVEKSGLGVFGDVNLLNFRASYAQFWKLPNKFYFSNYTSAYISTPNDQPYSMLNGLGFGNDVVRGYELYVIHGQNYVINKTSLKYDIFSGSTELKKFPLQQFRHFPYAFYLKTYFDVGYASNVINYEGNQRLADQLLLGGGIGLDVVTLYDIIMRFEYSFNSIGENGLFFAITSAF